MIVSLLVAACGSSGTTGAIQTPPPATPTAPPAASNPPSISGVTDAKDLMTTDEAAQLLGEAIKSEGAGTVDLYLGSLGGWTFTGATYGAHATVGIAPADGAATDACKPAVSCPTFDAVKAGQPSGAETFVGIGDDAFGAWQQGTGRPPILVGARTGAIAVYLYVDTLLYHRMKALLPILIARV